jgi:hypothetical protein
MALDVIVVSWRELVIFKSKKTGDYHEEMHGELSSKQFEKILPKLEAGGVIVMHKAPYRSVRLSRGPGT